MSNSSIRTVLLFSIIALVLVGASIGGVRLIKARNDSYADSHGKVAQTDTKPQPVQQKADTSKPATTDQKKNATNSNSQPQAQPQKNNSATTAVPPVTNPTSAPSSDAKSTPAPAPRPEVQAQSHSNLPATSGFTPAEALPTIILIALAGFFGNKLLRARADYRRYIGS